MPHQMVYGIAESIHCSKTLIQARFSEHYCIKLLQSRAPIVVPMRGWLVDAPHNCPAPEWRAEIATHSASHP